MIAGWLTPPLLPAVAGMVLLAYVPRRWRLLQLLAVLGWTTVWLDNQLTASWPDGVGLAVVTGSLARIAHAAAKELSTRSGESRP